MQESCEQPLSGWFGHSRPFAFESSYAPAEGAQRFQCGTPPILSLVALEVVNPEHSVPFKSPDVQVHSRNEVTYAPICFVKTFQKDREIYWAAV